MATQFVTGGAGFIGANYVAHVLAQTDDRIVVIDALTYAGNLASLEAVSQHPRFAFVKADIADGAAMRELFRAHQPLRVVNFAAESHVDRSIDGPRAFVQTNVMGTFELLEAARDVMRGMNDETRKAFRFLHVSTDEVYGSLGETGLFTENTPYAPNSPYSATKASADHLVRAWHETFGVPTIITNCSNNYGPFQFPEKLIPLMTLNALEAKNLPIYGDGGNIRDWLYVQDHCEGILLALQRGAPGEKYNIGGGNERTNLHIVDTLCALLDEFVPNNPALLQRGMRSYKELKTFVKDRPGHDRRYAIDATKIREALGWKSQHTFEVGLRRTVQWYLEHRAWCTTVQQGKYARERLGL